jgi:hypothetical protein
VGGMKNNFKIFRNLRSKIILVFCAVFIFSGCTKRSASKNKIDQVKHKHSVSFVVHLFPIAKLPDVISESSGLVLTNPNSLWTHNDSRGKPEIFNLDSSGIYRRKITLRNEPNVDWEEITKDADGNVFVGDFGNNECKRRGLMIYKFTNPDLIQTDSLSAQDIFFSYPDQHDFPPAADEMNFDAEAMMVLNQSIYIFSKNRSTPYSGYTKLYKVPAVPGNYIAQLADSFYTGHNSVKECSITGAAINNSHTILVLTSHEKIWVFTNFTDDKFFDGNIKELSFFGKDLSVEGVCFKSEKEIYLTEERSAPGEGKLFYLDLSEILELKN